MPGGEPVQGSRGEDADRRRRRVRVLLAAAVRRQRPHLLRLTAERRRLRVPPADADRHPGGSVGRPVQLRREPGRLLPLQRQVPRRFSTTAGCRSVLLRTDCVERWSSPVVSGRRHG